MKSSINNITSSKVNNQKCNENSISSKLKESLYNFEEFIEKYLNSDEIAKNRVYLLRHGYTTECASSGTKKKSKQAGLTGIYEVNGGEQKKILFDKSGVLQVYKASRLINRSIVNSDNVYIWGDGSTNRISETIDIIQNELGIKDENIVCDIESLDSRPVREREMSTKFLAGMIHDNFVSNILLPELKQKSNISLILILHKSSTSNLENIFDDTKMGFNTKYDHAYGEIREWDYTKSGFFLNSSNKSILRLNHNNFSAVKRNLLGNNILGKILTDKNFNKLELFEKQNYINAYFRAHNGLFTEYLLSPQPDLRQFCAINLIKQNKINQVFDNLLQLLELAVNQGRIDTLLNIFETLNQSDKERFIKIISKNVRSKDVSTKLNINDDFANFISYAMFMQPGINFLRTRSLDANINQGKTLPINVKFDNGKYDNIEKLISEKGITVIEGEAGAGKSIKMLEILEHCATTSKFAMYINLGDIRVEKLLGEIDGNEKYKRADVILLDALDESKYTNEEKKQLFDIIKDLSSSQKVIITSRPGNLPRSEDGRDQREMPQHELLNMKPLDLEQIDKYVNQKLDAKQIATWNQFKQTEFIKEIESNPLILNMLCNLIENNEDLSCIQTKGDLYEKIVDLRLNEWEGMKSALDVDEDLEDRKKLLGEIAYELEITGKSNIDESFILEIINSNKEYRKCLPKINNKFDLSCLNFILKKGEDGTYQFVHESFREYFLVKEILTKYEKGKNIELDVIKVKKNTPVVSMITNESSILGDIDIDEFLESIRGEENNDLFINKNYGSLNQIVDLINGNYKLKFNTNFDDIQELGAELILDDIGNQASILLNNEDLLNSLLGLNDLTNIFNFGCGDEINREIGIELSEKMRNNKSDIVFSNGNYIIELILNYGLSKNKNDYVKNLLISWIDKYFNFSDACQDGSVNLIEYVIRLYCNGLINIDFNKFNYYGTHGIFDLYHKNNEELLKYLLTIRDNEGKFIINYNLLNKNGDNLFLSLFYKGDINIINWALTLKDESGKNIFNLNDKNFAGENGFMIACKSGNISLVTFLLNIRDNDGNHIVEINECDYNGEDGFFKACKNGYFEIVKLICDGYDNDSDYTYDLKNRFKFGFMMSCKEGYYKIVSYLMDIYKKYKYLFSFDDNNFFLICYYYSYIKGAFDVSLFLYKFISNSLIHDLSSYFHCDRYLMLNGIKGLLELKDDNGDFIVNIIERDNKGRNLFMFVCEYGSIEDIELCLNIKDKNGNKLFSVYDCDLSGRYAFEYAFINSVEPDVKSYFTKTGKKKKVRKTLKHNVNSELIDIMENLANEL